ncbi:MAG: hypothetical protein IJQ81_16275 [Oscillibacter sp.]|nr:hypothetical protein [Oscillibacter sp.]
MYKSYRYVHCAAVRQAPERKRRRARNVGVRSGQTLLGKRGGDKSEGIRS